jgi:NADP-dependent 3-hydroxy acid dehydrogenase YdfG
VATRLLCEGHRVSVTGRNRDRLSRLASELGNPADLLAFAGDAADYATVRSAVESTVSKFGQLDTIVANAAFAAKGNLADGDPDEWREMVLSLSSRPG